MSDKEIEQREILFRYWYSDGESKFRIDFTIAEIENGDPIDEICDYKIVARSQCIGIEDNNGNKIFEGDRLKWHYNYLDTDKIVIGTVEYDLCNPCFVLNGDKKNSIEFDFVMCGHCELEIIGSVHTGVDDE